MLFNLFIRGGFYHVYRHYGFDYIQLYAHAHIIGPPQLFSNISKKGLMGAS